MRHDEHAAVCAADVAAERERVAGLVEAAMRSLAAAIRNGDAAPPRRRRAKAATAGAATAGAAQAKPARSAAPITPEEAAVVDRVWSVFPARPEPHPFVPARQALVTLLRDGVPATTLVNAALRYAHAVRRQGTEPQFVIGIVRFYRDGLFAHYGDAPMVFGRTREEWARSGQDVDEFDRLAGEIRAKETMSA